MYCYFRIRLICYGYTVGIRLEGSAAIVAFNVITVTLNPALDRTYEVSSFLEGGLNRASNVRMDAGGKGINVARGLTLLKVPALATGFIGGSQGDLLENRLKEEGVPCEFMKVPGNTRINIKIADQTTGLTTEINEAGFPLMQSHLEAFLSKLEALCVQLKASCLALSGGIPPETDAGFYSNIISRMKALGVRAVLDADGKPLKEGVKAGPFAIKPNIHELSVLAGRPIESEADVIEQCRQLLSQGIQWIGVTLGEKGVLLAGQEGFFRALPFSIHPLSTTGAGDAALAAFLYGLSKNLDGKALAAIMTCGGTLAAQKPGTAACTEEELLSNLHRVKVEKLKP